MAQALTIGQLAQATGVAAKTIRYYAQVGVLPPPRRTAAGYRIDSMPSHNQSAGLRSCSRIWSGSTGKK